MHARSGHVIVGVDTGGTFTDLIAIDIPRVPNTQVGLYAHKVLSTPEDPATAVLQGLDELVEAHFPDSSPTITVVHGSTVATNALLERRGVKTAFVTTAGFESLPAIGRQNRASLYDLHPKAKEPLVPHELCFGLAERVTHTGDVLEPLNPAETDALVERLLAEGVQSVAVCLLFSYVYAEHEAAFAQACRRRGLPVSASHQILPEHREYERASTTLVNAYVSPLMQRYLGRLEASLQERSIPGLHVMQSSGGSISARQAGEEAVHTVLSGPAGGVVGAHAAARRAGFPNALTFDMGGTSTDVSLVPGTLQVTTEGEIDGLPVRVPILAIHTVGAGGGSIAALDPGGALTVGPRSAGALPGPACYGRGGKLPTVTDAHVALGRLPADHFLGGRMRLDVDAATAACRDLAAQMGSTVDDAAYGILQVANVQMERALRVISVEKGHDPSEFTLVSFGGAGGLHACDLARGLGVPRVLIPAHPGVLSAWGMAVADIVKTYSQGVLGRLDASKCAEAGTALDKLAAQAVRDLQRAGAPVPQVVLQPAVDLRYEGQSFELSLPLAEQRLDPGDTPLPTRLVDGEMAAAFHAAHERAYGHRFDDAVEVVAVRLRAVCPGPAAAMAAPAHQATTQRPEPVGHTTAHHGEGRIVTPIYRRNALDPGSVMPGPALVVEPHATTVVGPRDRLQVLPGGDLVIEVADA